MGGETRSRDPGRLGGYRSPARRHPASQQRRLDRFLSAIRDGASFGCACADTGVTPAHIIELLESDPELAARFARALSLQPDDPGP